jgi:pimeloyl-ACP methyl ester carboxylesterase
MNTAEAFLRADTRERLTMLRDDSMQLELSGLLGAPAYAELRSVAIKRFDGTHLAADAPKNMIFVPGIMGTLLMNRALAGIWWIDVRTRNFIDRLGLSADGNTDADGLDNIAPVTADTTYTPFLSAALAEPELNHEIFPFDWRKSLLSSASAFRDLVLKLYRDNGGMPVHIVAHSMGGLMTRAALMQHGPELWPRIGKIVFIATPHYGATAIAGYLKNHLWGFELMALLGNYLSRATLRSLWGFINLLPAPHGVYPGTRPNDPHPWNSGSPGDPYVHPCGNFDFYQAAAWKLQLTGDETAKLQHILDATADFHRRLHQAHGDLDQELRDKMVVIAGVGYNTLFRLADEPGFLGLWEKTAKVFDRVLDNPHRDGDGRVPLASADLKNIGGTRYVHGVHGGLPNIPAVYQDVFRCLKGEPMQLPDTVAGAVGGHLAEPAVSEAPHLDGSASAPSFSDDPGLWNLDHPSPERIKQLEGMLEAETLPAFGRIHLL